VRARPGVALDNPPLEYLRSGTEVDIFEEREVLGTVWYRIGGDRWVHGGWVELSEEPFPEPPPEGPSEPVGWGVVTAELLNVRARPGVDPNNPPIDRLLGGTEIDIFEERLVAGIVWYRIDEDRWVHSGWVRRLQEPPPVPLPEPQPEPQPEPPPEPPSEVVGYGIVVASTLNVRAHPGVRPDNPTLDQLPNGALVDIYEKHTYLGEVWYRIGVDRWVHSDWVRRTDDSPPAPPPEPSPGPSPGPPPDSPDEPIATGVVTASLLNVRAQPGVRSSNPPVDQLWSGTDVDIFHEEEVTGDIWYLIGEDRWVHSGWVRVLERFTPALVAAPMAGLPDPVDLPVGWVVSQVLQVRSEPGATVENPPVDELVHNQVLPILETRQSAGRPWYRIGQDRWVDGAYVAVARFKPRPSTIGSQERWVGVSLKEQTAVAYEGDQPVYAVMVASGLPGTPTVQGIFRTWSRLPTGRMTGPGYYLEDVTWTCYFYSGYSLHAAYWHDGFGAPRSHGCVNLSPYDAWWLFEWSKPGGPDSPTVYVYWA